MEINFRITDELLTKHFQKLEEKTKGYSPEVAAVLGFAGTVESMVERNSTLIEDLRKELIDGESIRNLSVREIFENGFGEFFIGGGLVLASYDCVLIGHFITSDDFVLLAANGDRIFLTQTH